MDQSRIARRSNPRYELEKILQGHTQCSAPVHLLDLSTTGALLEYHQYLKPGEELELLLQLGGSRYKILCSVVHCSILDVKHTPRSTLERAIYHVGVKLIDLSSYGREAIQNLIKERLENERREQPRLYIGRTANLQENIEIRAVNIGRDGGLFTVVHPLEAGSAHDFIIQLPNGEVRVRGTVRHFQRWRHSDEARFQIGVEFTGFQTSVKTRYFGTMPRKLNAPRNCPQEGDEIQRRPC